jgi:hypothetical protein
MLDSDDQMDATVHLGLAAVGVMVVAADVELGEVNSYLQQQQEGQLMA